MNWVNLWMKLFGTTEFLGLNMGFWISMAVVALIVILMNVVFWSMKPKSE
jgi:disulfide bond formation protein DsbB